MISHYCENGTVMIIVENYACPGYYFPAIQCGPPPAVLWGTANLTGTHFNDSAIYSCDEGYELVGNLVTTCEATGQWAPVPSCESK